MRKPRTRATWRVALLISLSCAFVAAVHGQSAPLAQHSPARSCLEAAHKALGPDAEVLKCGHLTNSGALETIAAIRLKQFRVTADGIPVSRLVILRRVGPSQWNAELTADKNWIRNSAGYIGIDFIDDSDPSIGYRASFSNHRSDDVAAFDIGLYYLNPDGHNEGMAVEISWNPSVRRFQEFAYGQDPEGFRPEIKNPPHLSCGKCPG